MHCPSRRPNLWSHCYKLVTDRGNSRRAGNVKFSRPVTSHPTDFILFQWCHPSPLTLSFSFTMSTHPLVPPCSAFNKVSSLETRNGLPIFSAAPQFIVLERFWFIKLIPPEENCFDLWLCADLRTGQLNTANQIDITDNWQYIYCLLTEVLTFRHRASSI